MCKGKERRGKEREGRRGRGRRGRRKGKGEVVVVGEGNESSRAVKRGC